MTAALQQLLYTFPTQIEATPEQALALRWAPGTDPFNNALDLGSNDALHGIRLRPEALTAAECQAVIALGDARPRSDGRTDLGPHGYRVSHITWIEPEPDTHWLFHKLGALFAEAGQHFGMELSGLIDALQYTVYESDQHFNWHMDLGPGSNSLRKLSMTLQLSDTQDYQGGMLEFMNAPTLPASRPVGSAIFFPSYLTHRVAPVESGVRRSLVAWACGPAFR